MPANVKSMAYYGEVPWHGLGVRVAHAADSATMIRAAGLDWAVEMRPVPGARLDRKGEPLKYQLVRRGRTSLEPDVLLAVVSPRYTPLQNWEAFEFFDSIVGARAAMYHTAGAIGDGERVWVLAKLPGEIRVAGDDIVEKYLLLSNAHNGKESVSIKFTPIRVVCQNTLMLALKTGEKPVRVRHTANIWERLYDVPDLLGIFKTTSDAAERTFQALARVQLNAAKLYVYLDEVFPRSDEQRKQGKWPAQWDHVAELFERHSDDPASVQGTLWAAYNAITRFEDYRQAREAASFRRLQRVWFGPGADLKMRALQRAEELAQQWAV